MNGPVLVNGTQRTWAVATSLADLVAVMAPAARGVAVAVNGAVVPRSEWERTPLVAGDQVEVLVASQGG
jgi:sulfur carrier protein